MWIKGAKLQQTAVQKWLGVDLNTYMGRSLLRLGIAADVVHGEKGYPWQAEESDTKEKDGSVKRQRWVWLGNCAYPK